MPSDLLRPIRGGTVLSMAVYPEKAAPGRPLTTAQVGTEGLEGDRRKKRPVHLVGRENDPDSTRANFFLDVSDVDLQRLVGEEVHVGRVVLRFTEVPKNCPGVYADVVRAGVVNVGDALS
ncbi:hypothetical protein [Mobilicoccus caccae]|uniref:MOSC domain-containing protein n=1 Tax=Mobilicoccus caccae TaxID=1859295 RepID=A0ABQ6IP52_9MICO|nr:hypothetical protein [Mobilicoccus caccae]GMA39670.1 hypothetical protein GCM10025883_17150 [Mobilicoccus caccae]